MSLEEEGSIDPCGVHNPVGRQKWWTCESLSLSWMQPWDIWKEFFLFFVAVSFHKISEEADYENAFPFAQTNWSAFTRMCCHGMQFSVMGGRRRELTTQRGGERKELRSITDAFPSFKHSIFNFFLHFGMHIEWEEFTVILSGCVFSLSVSAL